MWRRSSDVDDGDFGEVDLEQADDDVDSVELVRLDALPAPRTSTLGTGRASDGGGSGGGGPIGRSGGRRRDGRGDGAGQGTGQGTAESRSGAPAARGQAAGPGKPTGVTASGTIIGWDIISKIPWDIVFLLGGGASRRLKS
jgi:hypothetical protein